MPRKRSNLLCPRCKRIGGFLTKRWVKRTNSIPRFDEVTTIAQAWDYAATVYLQLHAALIRFPPDDKEFDKSFSRAIYKEFSNICPYTPNKISKFETRQMNRLLLGKRKRRVHVQSIKSGYRQDKNNRLSSSEYQQYYWQDHDPYKKKISIPLPSNSGRVTSTSIACIYGALIFKTLSYVFMHHTFSDNENRFYSYVIYTLFSTYSAYYDDRYHISITEWLKICKDAKNHGLSSASSLNPVFTLEGKRVQHSPRHIRNKLIKVENQLHDIIFCTPYYIQLIDTISSVIKTNQASRKLFLTIFDRLEQQLNEEKFGNTREYYFIKHTLTTKPKIKWCPISQRNLAYVTVVDERYKLYESFVFKIAAVIGPHSPPQDEKFGKYISAAGSILRQLGFRTDLIYDKIKSDIIAECFNRFMFMRTIDNEVNNLGLT